MLSRLSVKKPYTVLVGVIFVIVLGIVSITRMTTDLLPDMKLPYVLVLTTDMGASPEEAESDVTAPIEAAMATTSNIKNISSASYNNYSMVILEFEQSSNMESILIEVQQKLDQLEGQFPDTVGKPIMMQIDPDMMPIMIASADVEGMTQSEISDYVTQELIPAVESIEGVASVSATGTLKESIKVTIDPKKTSALNEQIFEKINEQFVEPQEELDRAADEIQNGKAQMENGKQELADQLGQAQNEILNGKSQAFVMESDLNQNRTVLQGAGQLIAAAIPQLQGIYDKGMAIKQELIQLQEQVNQAGQEHADRVNMILNNPELAGRQEELNELLIQGGADEAAIADMNVRINELNRQLLELNETLTGQWAEQMQAFDIHLGAIEDIPQVIAQLSVKQAELGSASAAIDTAQAQVSEGQTTLDDAFVALNRTQIGGILQMSEAAAKLADGENQLAQGQAKLDEAKKSAQDAADVEKILSVEMLGNLLTAQNFAMPAGYVQDGDIEYMVRVGNEITSVEELKNLVLLDVGMEGIEPIRLSSVADVSVIDNSKESYSKVNGNPAVMLSIEKQTGFSTGDVTKRIKQRFASLEKEKDGLAMTVLMNQGVYIDLIVNSVVENMVFGALLAVLVLIAFLKDFRPTFVIACSIPLSVIFAIIMMYFSNISLNIISLSGLALGIGMLVDNSIVVIENIYRLRSEGYSLRKAAVEGASQVTGAIFASTLTTICVFAPIIFTEGITRQLFVDIALTIAFTLTASLIVALTFVPMMASGMLKTTKEVRHDFFDKIKDGYEKVLKVCLRWKPIVFLAVIVLLVASVKLSLSRGFSFMNMDMEANQLSVTIAPKEGEILEFEELTAMSDDIVEKISGISGIQSIGAMAGGSGMMSLGSGKDSVTLYVLLDEENKVPLSDITAQIKALTADMDCEVSTDNSSSDMSSFFGNGISVQIRGNDLDKLQELAKQVGAILEKTEGTTKVEDGLDDTTPSFTVVVDKGAAAKYKMTTAQVFQIVYAAMAPDTAATTVSADLKEYQVYVQSGEQSKVTLSDIKNLTFPYTDMMGDTEEIKLSEIADFKEGSSLNTISRDGQTRYISVSAGIDAEHNVTLVSNQVQKELKKIKLPDGYSIEMKGEDEAIADAMNQLYLMLLLAVIFIYLIMVAQFQSFLSPFIIMFTIPLAFTGGFFALYFTGNEVSVIAMIGFVMLAGIIVNNGIVMVDYINQLREGGMDKREAILESGKTRLRPILMTALTTILAMSTMAAGIGNGSEMMQPMAIVTEGGLIYGTLLTLIVVPCIYDALTSNKSMVKEEL